MIGSLIQQNFGETITNHGYGVYTIDNDNYDFVDLENPQPYLSFKINSYDDIKNNNGVDPENMKVLFNAYIKLIDAIIARLPLVKIKLFNIYSPLSKNYLIYNAPIRKWNGLLDTKFQPYRNVSIINNFSFMNQRADFNYEIEPSPIGAEKITNAILLNA
jgi:hypothetical protein